MMETIKRHVNLNTVLMMVFGSIFGAIGHLAVEKIDQTNTAIITIGVRLDAIEKRQAAYEDELKELRSEIKRVRRP